MSNTDSFFEKPVRRDREGRPRMINPLTGDVQTWQRASNYAAPLDSPFGLLKHQLRHLVYGLSLRPDLLRMLLASGGMNDTEKVDEIISTAHSAAELSAPANNGTAVHSALQLFDLGREVPTEYQPHAQAYYTELRRHGLRPVAIEQTVMNTKLGAVGQFDRVFQEADGTLVIGDIKTGRIDHPHKFAVQCEVYTGADYLLTGDPIGPVQLPWNLSRTHAILVHVNPETGATSVYRVDLRLGAYGANLATQVREWPKTTVLLPYVAPGGSLPTAQPVTPPTREQLTAAVSTPEAQALGMDEDDAAAVLAHVQQAAPQPSIVAGTDLSAPGREAAVGAYPVLTVGTAEYEAEVAKLSKLPKPELQRMLSDLGGTDLARHRSTLAKSIIAARNQVQPHGPGTQPTVPADAQVAQTVEQDVPAAEATPFTLKQIAEAPTVADIKRLHDNIVQRSGNQAWSDAMAEVAKRRVAELDEQDANRVRGEISAAITTQELAAIWDRVTIGGSALSKWEQFQAQALAQQQKIQAEQPPAPGNPFGGQ